VSLVYLSPDSQQILEDGTLTIDPPQLLNLPHPTLLLYPCSRMGWDGVQKGQAVHFSIVCSHPGYLFVLMRYLYVIIQQGTTYSIILVLPTTFMTMINSSFFFPEVFFSLLVLYIHQIWGCVEWDRQASVVTLAQGPVLPLAHISTPLWAPILFFEQMELSFQKLRDCAANIVKRNALQQLCHSGAKFFTFPKTSKWNSHTIHQIFTELKRFPFINQYHMHPILSHSSKYCIILTIVSPPKRTNS